MTPRAPLQRPQLTVSVLCTVASVLPAFLTGALAVQLREELDFGATGLGLAVAAFFIAGVVGSAPLGHWGERIGARHAMTIGLATIVVADIAVAAADDWISLALPLVVAGAANALNQSAANLLLGRTAAPERLIFSVSVKQAGMPTATLLAGLAVPGIAETIGWRWAYLAAATVAATALLVVRRTGGSPRPDASGGLTPRPDLDRTTFLVIVAAVAFAAYMAGALASWTVSSAEAAGLTAGGAGLLLAGGSGLGITARLLVGHWADTGEHRLLVVVSAMLVVGAGGIAVIGIGTPLTAVLGSSVAFASGWAWPGLTNGTVVKVNPSAPGAATGITQTGTYLGVVLGPVVTGVLVDGPGYATAWTVAAACGVVAAVLMLVGQRRLDTLALRPALSGASAPPGAS